MNLRNCMIGLLFVAGVTSASAQSTGEVVMKAAIGSFKILSPGDKDNARGRVEMSFKGTLLLVNYSGAAPVLTGNFKKEYENTKEKRVVYFGQGKVVLDGNWRAIQWFGTELSMRWIGMGVCRVYGEFDKTGKTGTYQITGDTMPRYWGSGGMQFQLPSQFVAPTKAPKIKRG